MNNSTYNSGTHHIIRSFLCHLFHVQFNFDSFYIILHIKSTTVSQYVVVVKKIPKKLSLTLTE